jgi:hypothetical protein
LEETGEKIVLPDAYMFQFTPNATAATSTVATEEPVAGQPRTDGEPAQSTDELEIVEPEPDESGFEPGETEAGTEEVEKVDASQDKDLLGAQS